MLVDTSVWVDHLRGSNRRLIRLLEEGVVYTHPFIVGEITCGSLGNRQEVLALLASLPKATVASDSEVLAWLTSERLFGRGVGWVDIHLLASARLSGFPLWTLDRRLARLAHELGLAPGF